MKLYHHKTDGGAEYLTDTFIVCPNGHEEGVLNDETRYVVRIDGDITKDAEMIAAKPHDALLEACKIALQAINECDMEVGLFDATEQEITDKLYAAIAKAGD